MAAMSAVPAGTSTFASSHGNGSGSNGESNGYSWSISTGANDEIPKQSKRAAAPTNSNEATTNGYSRSPVLSQNGNANTASSGVAVGSSRSDNDSWDVYGGENGMSGAGYRSQPYGSDRPIKPASKPASIQEHSASPSDSLSDLHDNGNRGGKRSNASQSPVEQVDDESSKWIHRDKLARIESEELQAAGIILPTPRARSRPRHNTSSTTLNERNGTRSRAGDADGHSGRSRNHSAAATTTPAGIGEARTQDLAVPSWDLRHPEEIYESNYFTSATGASNKTSSRIPVAKSSPVPIPTDYIERETPAPRRRDSSPDEAPGTIRMPKTRTRSNSASTKPDAATTSATATAPHLPHQQSRRTLTDTSPKKGPAGGARKGSGPAKANGAAGRPKTRGGPSKDSTGSSNGTTRPPTRSGERELSPSTSTGGPRPPEGEPPWMVSAYKPDPRLPPDQQLLPTVARRLQQEKWEREGKFGNVYDKQFRPLSGDFLAPPQPKSPGVASSEDEEKQSDLLDEKRGSRGSRQSRQSQQAEEWPLKPEPRSPTSPGLRLQKTGSYSTIPKIQDPPVSPIPPGSRGNAAPPPQPVRVPDVPEDPKKKEKGCLCCVVM